MLYNFPWRRNPLSVLLQVSGGGKSGEDQVKVRAMALFGARTRTGLDAQQIGLITRSQVFDSSDLGVGAGLQFAYAERLFLASCLPDMLNTVSPGAL